MLAPGLVVWKPVRHRARAMPPVEVVGQQWQWSFRLPGADGKLGAETATSPPTIRSASSPTIRNGQDDVIIEGGELHLPLGKPVKMLLRSLDVLHDFYVPEFRAKMDMIPGSVTYFWFTPTRTGTFEVLCAELCGVGHPLDARRASSSRRRQDYQAWLAAADIRPLGTISAQAEPAN
jgi:cytochrome c oxidase subunit 2